ncbi:MAG: hypothetical protein RBU37_05270 [Myxococcota bacterium]|jgi:hypothetical protein|nr:hypothetical protein [Myxococcota bacterium]
MKRLLVSLNILLLVTTTATIASAQEEEPRCERCIEWFGMQLGMGWNWFNVGRQDPDDYGLEVDRAVPRTDILIATLQWPSAYLTVLELHPFFFLGYLGAGTRAGVRLPLTTDRHHELRIGAGASADFFLYHINAFTMSLTLSPHLQYVHQTELGSVGVGFEVPLSFPFKEELIGGDGHSVEVDPMMTGVHLYFRFTVGRTAR